MPNKMYWIDDDGNEHEMEFCETGEVFGPDSAQDDDPPKKRDLSEFASGTISAEFVLRSWPDNDCYRVDLQRIGARRMADERGRN